MSLVIFFLASFMSVQAQVLEQEVRVEIQAENSQKARVALLSKAGEQAVLQVLTSELGPERVSELQATLEKRLFPDLSRHLPLIRPGEVETLTPNKQFAMSAKVKVDLPSLRRRLGELKISEYAPKKSGESPFFLETLTAEKHIEDVGEKELITQFQKKGIYRLVKQRERAHYVLRQSIDPFVLTTGRKIQVQWTVFDYRTGEIIFNQKRSQLISTDAQTPRVVRDLINDLMSEWTSTVWQKQGLDVQTLVLQLPGLKSLVEREKITKILQTLHPQVQKVRPLMYDQEGSEIEVLFAGELSVLKPRLQSITADAGSGHRYDLVQMENGVAQFKKNP